MFTVGKNESGTVSFTRKAKLKRFLHYSTSNNGLEHIRAFVYVTVMMCVWFVCSK